MRHDIHPFNLSSTQRRRGFTLIEVLVALVILLAGIVGIVQLFPVSLQANADAEIKGTAVLLAQKKVDELRRDADTLDVIMTTIEMRDTETAPVVFPEDDRFTYSYMGESVYGPTGNPMDPRDDSDVARVIIRLNNTVDPDRPVIYEMRFDV